MKKILFLKNAAVLTASSLLLRLIGVGFRVWVAGRIGAQGMGLYALILSVAGFASAFASGGICTAATRLMTEEIALGSQKGVTAVLRKTATASLVLGALSAAVLFGLSEPIAATLLSDGRAAASLRWFSLSLPFLGLSSCLKGYFLARRRSLPPSAVQIGEQLLRLLLTVIFLRRVAAGDLAAACAALSLGDAVSEAAAAGLLFLCYRADRKTLRLPARRAHTKRLGRAVAHIALPITLGRYGNSLLRTAENLAVPRALAQYRGGENALAQFGAVKGMALPLLLFPSALLGALSALLIPELSEALARGWKTVVRQSVERILRATLLLSFPMAAAFFAVGRPLGLLFYQSESVGSLLAAHSPNVPFLYLDSICDGLLKGLDEQRFAFRTALLDSTLRLLLLPLILPRYGMTGFLGIMYGSNLFTALLNAGRVLRACGGRTDGWRTVAAPLLLSFLLGLAARGAVPQLADWPLFARAVFPTAGIFVLYFGLLWLFGLFDPGEWLGKCRVTKDRAASAPLVSAAD